MWDHKVLKGTKDEVKLLESKDRMAIRRKVIMIRKFLGMEIDEMIHDQRQGRMRM